MDGQVRINVQNIRVLTKSNPYFVYVGKYSFFPKLTPVSSLRHYTYTRGRGARSIAGTGEFHDRSTKALHPDTFDSAESLSKGFSWTLQSMLTVSGLYGQSFQKYRLGNFFELFFILDSCSSLTARYNASQTLPKLTLIQSVTSSLYRIKKQDYYFVDGSTIFYSNADTLGK